jgi:hypothetical protein
VPLSSGSESEEVEDDNRLHFPTAGRHVTLCWYSWWCYLSACQRTLCPTEQANIYSFLDVFFKF